MPKRKRKNDDGTKKEVKFKGITKRGKRFQAQISIDGKMQALGMFDTPKEAAEAFDHAAIQAGKPTSKLNFLDQIPKTYKPKNNGLQSNNTTGFKGVYKIGNRFQAQITIGGKQQGIGMLTLRKVSRSGSDYDDDLA